MSGVPSGGFPGSGHATQSRTFVNNYDTFFVAERAPGLLQKSPRSLRRLRFVREKRVPRRKHESVP